MENDLRTIWHMTIETKKLFKNIFRSFLLEDFLE